MQGAATLFFSRLRRAPIGARIELAVTGQPTAIASRCFAIKCCQLPVDFPA